MIGDNVSLLLDIENAYEAVKLNLDSISYLQSQLGSGAIGYGTSQNLILHLVYLCELDAGLRLSEMKAAIDAMREHV
jgi:hypothetical protein